MCGRYTLIVDSQDLITEFALTSVAQFAPRYNVAPTQDVPIIRRRMLVPAGVSGVIRQAGSSSERTLELLRWGLIPSWAKDAKFSINTINARAETVATQPAFRSAFRKRRCIVPASGFYEWQTISAKGKGKPEKVPHYFRRSDGRPLALAGLWEEWHSPEGEVIQSFTIITTTANELVSPLHNRMPVVLGREDYDVWLDEDSPIEQLQALLKPCPASWLSVSIVGKQVNNSRIDSPSCLEPPPQVTPPQGLLDFESS